MTDKPHYPLYIDGQFTAGHGAEVWESINPASDESWATFDCAAADDVERAVRAARAAQLNPAWRDMTGTARGKLLFKLADLVEQHAGELGRLETMDSGKLLSETSAQTGYVADYYRYFAGLADKLEGAVLPIDKPDMHVYTLQEPIGIVCAVVPWNAQMFLSATKLGPALAAGCSVILKASEQAPCPMLYFAELLDQVGFPPGVVQVITGDIKQCSEPLTAHPDIDRIAFTGGTAAAKKVVQNSAENFAVTTLELGGKSPIIVFESADLESAANGLIAGNFGASGQSCVAGTRALIQRSVLPELLERLKEKTEAIQVGDPLDPTTHVGPLCTAAQIQKIEATLVQAQKQGAEIHAGGHSVEQESGYYFEPTIVECPNAEIATLKVEMFGPVMSLLAFDTEEQALALANDSDFGLGSGLFTTNMTQAYRVSRLIHSGICWVNTYRAISPIAPFGGYKQSGYAREAGSQALADYTRTKTVWINLSDEQMANPFVMR